jgi:hypothetical protein
MGGGRQVSKLQGRDRFRWHMNRSAIVWSHFGGIVVTGNECSTGIRLPGDLRAVKHRSAPTFGTRSCITGTTGGTAHETRAKQPKAALDALKARIAGPDPVVKYDAPTDDAQAVELFAKVRTGAAEAFERLHTLIRQRKWVHQRLHPLGATGSNSVHLVALRDRRTNRRTTRAKAAEPLEMSMKNLR